MINKIIHFSIKNKLIIGLFVLAIIGMGIYSMQTINLGVKPDITNNQVQVITVSQNLSTEDIEQFVTYPVELALGNLPGVKEIRSISRFGLSVVTVVFKDDMGMYLPRQLVQEKLNEVKETIPKGFGSPEMGPISTGLGEIYQYTITPQPGFENKYSPRQLRTIQDWIVKRQLTMLKGVVEVNAFGGSIKQYVVLLDPSQLNAMNISIAEVFEALEKNNVNTGGAYIEKNNRANFIRGEGLVQSIEDIESIVVKNIDGYPILVKDIAKSVKFGNQVRYGAFTKDGKEAVGGMVLMLRGSNPDKVIVRVKDRIKSIQKSLPEGLKIEPFLDRSELIHRTTGTIIKNLTEGALIVIFVLVILLGSLRGGLITASVIPLSLLFAFILMKEFGIWANLMSLGAIDFGIIVDGAVIIVEGTVHQIEKYLRQNKDKKVNLETMDRLSYQAGTTMMNTAFFGQLIILIVFMPILFLTGVEGKMFRPMAFTFSFAVLGALILCLTYVPMVSALIMRPLSPKKGLGKIEYFFERISKKTVKILLAGYHPVIKSALKIKGLIVIFALLLLGWAGFTFSNMGGEFIPELDEGDIAMHVLLRPGTALSETIEVSKKIEDTLLSNFPEIKTVTARIGVADIPTDPMPMDIADVFIILEKNQDKWVSAETKKELIQQIKQKLDFLTGVNLAFTQPIEMRFNELLTGVQQDVAVKLYGPDLEVLAEKGAEMAEIIQTVPGAEEATAERISGLPQIVIQYNRQKIAQYNLDITKINQYVNIAFAGASAGTVFEGEKRFDLVLRFDQSYRKNINDVRSLFIDLPNHTQIPLSEVANINFIPGPMQISRENTFRRTYVGVNVRGRDVKSVVKDIQEELDKQLQLPPGYHISYGGTFENLQRAEQRLALVVPISLFLIFILLYFALHSFKEAIMIFVVVPLSAIGGVFFLYLRGMPFSISAGVGFIVLFGVAVLNGLVLISRFNDLKQKGVSLKERIFIGTEERLRPILLTAMAAIMGFIPMAFSSSAGAEVQRPLATVVIGGLISATLLTLIVLPVIYALMEKIGAKNISPSLLLPLLLLVVAMGTTQISWAQTRKIDVLPQLSSMEAVARAIKNFPKIKASALEIEKSKALKKAVWDLGTTEVFTGREEFNRSNKGITTLVGIQQNDIDVFRMFAQSKLQEEKIEWARLTYRLNKLMLEQKVLAAWNKVYIAQKKHETYQEIDDLFTELAQKAETKYQTGEISQLEYLSNINQATQIHIKYDQQYADYQLALYQFNLWLASDTLFQINATIAPEVALSNQIDSLSIGNHIKLQLASEGVAIANAKWKTEQAAFLPKISGSYGLQRINGKPGFNSFQIGISIPLIFNKQVGNSRAAKIEKLQAEEAYKMTKIQFKNEYKRLKITYKKWLKTWSFYQNQSLPLVNKQRQAVITLYQSGAINFTTFLQNIQMVIQTKMAGWEALGKVLENKIKITYYLK